MMFSWWACLLASVCLLGLANAYPEISEPLAVPDEEESELEPGDVTVSVEDDGSDDLTLDLLNLPQGDDPLANPEMVSAIMAEVERLLDEEESEENEAALAGFRDRDRALDDWEKHEIARQQKYLDMDDDRAAQLQEQVDQLYKEFAQEMSSEAKNESSTPLDALSATTDLKTSKYELSPDSVLNRCQFVQWLKEKLSGNHLGNYAPLTCLAEARSGLQGGVKSVTNKVTGEKTHVFGALRIPEPICNEYMYWANGAGEQCIDYFKADAALDLTPYDFLFALGFGEQDLERVFKREKNKCCSESSLRSYVRECPDLFHIRDFLKDVLYKYDTNICVRMFGGPLKNEDSYRATREVNFSSNCESSSGEC